MSSSPSIPLTEKVPIQVVRSNGIEKYRQVVYHGSAGHRIAECRRRSQTGRHMQPTPSACPDWILYSKEDGKTQLKTHSLGVSLRTPSPASFSKESDVTCKVKHVTCVKNRSRRAKQKAVVILDSRTPRKATEDKSRPHLQDPAALMPPPTPRLGRLATPELSDLDQRPFCDCIAETPVVRICMSCRMEIEPYET